MAEDLFVVKSASTKEDFNFLAKLVTEEHVISAGVHSIAHVAPVLEPGFLIGFLNGERIGHICLIKCGNGSTDNDSTYYISFYFVDKQFRGKGYGLKIWKKMWEMLPKTANISLDAMLYMVPRYEKMGLHQEWPCKEYVVSCSRVVQTFQDVKENKACLSMEIEIKSLSEVSFDVLFEYDSSVFGFPRRDFLKKWITIPESLGWVATNRKDEIVGYAVIRHSVIEKHQVVGPLFCDNTHIARLLLYMAAKAAIEQRSAEKLAICIPAVGENKEAADMIEMEIGCDSTPLELMRMYSKGVPPQVCVKKIVSITSPIIG